MQYAVQSGSLLRAEGSAINNLASQQAQRRAVLGTLGCLASTRENLRRFLQKAHEQGGPAHARIMLMRLILMGSSLPVSFSPPTRVGVPTISGYLGAELLQTSLSSHPPVQLPTCPLSVHSPHPLPGASSPKQPMVGTENRA